MIEPDGRLQRFGAVAQCRLEIDQPANPMRLACLGDIGGADRVHLGVGIPVVRVLVGRSGMHHHLGSKFGEQAFDQSLIDNAAFDRGQAGMRRQIVAAAGGEIVDRQHGVAAREQQVRDRRADLARTARYQNFHH